MDREGVAEKCLNCLKLFHRRRLAAKIQPPGLWLNAGEQTKRSSVTFQLSRFSSDKTFSRCDRARDRGLSRLHYARSCQVYINSLEPHNYAPPSSPSHPSFATTSPAQELIQLSARHAW